MTDAQNKNKLSAVLAAMPVFLRNSICQSSAVLRDLREIRFRTNLPVVLNINGENRYVLKNGQIVSQTADVCVCNQQMITEVFKSICGYSVYAHLDEIVSGFVALPGGHRAGIGGTAVVTEGKIVNIRDVSSICIRISREVQGVAKELAEDFVKESGGLLICGVPLSGKTTILRDFARIVSAEFSLTTAVIDTRNELAGTYKGVRQHNLGFSDVLSSYPRGKGIEHALRGLSPQVIICDEIGSKEDVEGFLSGVNSGVRMVASIHAADKRELQSKVYAKEMLRLGCFSRVVFLSTPKTPGKISLSIRGRDVLSA